MISKTKIKELVKVIIREKREYEEMADTKIHLREAYMKGLINEEALPEDMFMMTKRWNRQANEFYDGTIQFAKDSIMKAFDKLIEQDDEWNADNRRHFTINFFTNTVQVNVSYVGKRLLSKEEIYNQARFDAMESFNALVDPILNEAPEGYRSDFYRIFEVARTQGIDISEKMFTILEEVWVKMED